jgi:hypothetical protein
MTDANPGVLEGAALHLAGSLRRIGLRDAARAVYRRILRHAPGNRRAHLGLARTDLPGDDYIEVLAAVHERLRPRVYLEIGVSQGASLRLARPPTFAAGVDPRPHLCHTCAAETEVFVETSDAFFAAYDSRPRLAGRCVDLAFLDGLHSFEQTLRDFINVERRAAPGALVLIHDCLPSDAAAAAREPRSFFWAGDVWKLIPILATWRPDLELTAIGAWPTGLLAIRRLDPASGVLERGYDEIVAAFMDMPFERFAAEWRPRLAIVRSNAAAVARLLSASAPTSTRA